MTKHQPTRLPRRMPAGGLSVIQLAESNVERCRNFLRRIFLKFFFLVFMVD